MSSGLRQLRLAAVNIDGVLLNDTFSPVIHNFVVSRGGAYSAEVERQIFSQPQRVASAYLTGVVSVPMTAQEALEAYFVEREAYLRQDPVRLLDGAVDLVRRLRGLGLSTICYGGLGKEHFDRFLGEWAHLFDGPGYVCTNDFRPGIREITNQVFGLAYDQVVFIDDVARVAESAKELGVPFIGHPSTFEHSHQRQLMREAGVRHLVDSLHAIDEAMLRTVDAEAAHGTIWARSEASLVQV
ncbi:haloacid dehalogenase-like hydrolase [Streptomyces sp. CB02009]|uniref:HAD family hydrolase n=1 Tax=Streptomyces sp. CB02009 TaxID=1703938 RepID=UPI000938F834|nr:HAD family hydrolase [Streptomyces sp. CB02009]OKJ48494.1 haloacid dehalogenase-like hydrolase [Streptomyces sp. CB02009]